MPDPSLLPLTERVRQRLDLAGMAYDRRTGASLPKGKRRKSAARNDGADEMTTHPSNPRERACLRTVFHELGDAHRRYRSHTGETVSPELREATTAFKQEPSLLSLVPVAAFLDDLGILAW